MNTVYKVTTSDRYSTSVGYSKYKLNYRINKITRPKIGLIFAFDNLDNAIVFTRGYTKPRIYECQTDTLYSLAQGGLVYTNDYSIDKYFEDLWITRNFASNINKHIKRTFPIGTV